nr:aspartyl protease family protein [uncultured Anaerocolumna sp.]
MQNKMNILYSKDVDIIDMSHDRFANLLMIDIFHKDNRIPFVFDTGASITTISTTVADKIGAVSLSASVTFIHIH